MPTPRIPIAESFDASRGDRERVRISVLCTFITRAPLHSWLNLRSDSIFVSLWECMRTTKIGPDLRLFLTVLVTFGKYPLTVWKSSLLSVWRGLNPSLSPIPIFLCLLFSQPILWGLVKSCGAPLSYSLCQARRWQGRRKNRLISQAKIRRAPSISLSPFHLCPGFLKKINDFSRWPGENSKSYKINDFSRTKSGAVHNVFLYYSLGA